MSPWLQIMRAGIFVPNKTITSCKQADNQVVTECLSMVC